MCVRAEVEIAEGLLKLLESCGGVYRPGNPIVSCKIYPDKLYSFVEFRSVEETSNCMALDGARFRGLLLKVSNSMHACSCLCVSVILKIDETRI